MADEKVCCLCGYVFDLNQDLEVHIKEEHWYIFRILPEHTEDQNVKHPSNLKDESSLRQQNGTQERKDGKQGQTKGGITQISTKKVNDEESPVQPKRKRSEDSTANCVLCEFCLKSFANAGKLKTHVEMTHPEACKFTCSHCNRRFLEEGQMVSHGIRAHRLFERKCDECGQIFGHLDELTRHIEKEHPNVQKAPCDKCDKKFVSIEKLRNHQIYFHSTKTAECDLCKKRYADKKILRKHVQRCHSKDNTISSPASENQTFDCKICSKGFDTQLLLKNHYLRIKRKKIFHCRVCDLAFLRKNFLGNHVELIHGLSKSVAGKDKLKLAEFTDEKVVCCPLCDFVTTNKNILNIHAHQKHEKDFVATNLNKITMTPKKPTITKSDTEIFERRNVLQKTKKKHGRRIVDKKFVCSICSKSFKRNPCLERHTLGVHLGISLNQYRHRSSGSRMVLNQRSIRCKRCDFFATTKTEVVHHFNAYHGDTTKEDRRMVRIIECTGCRRFTAPDHRRMAMHKRICYRSFPTSDQNPCQSFLCQFCNFRTLYKGKFNTHMTNRHNQNDPTDNKVIDKIPEKNIVKERNHPSNPNVLTGDPNPKEKVVKPHPEVLSNNLREGKVESGDMLGCLQCSFETHNPELFDSHWIEKHSKISMKTLLRASNQKLRSEKTTLKIKVDFNKFPQWQTLPTKRLVYPR